MGEIKGNRLLIVGVILVLVFIASYSTVGDYNRSVNDLRVEEKIERDALISLNYSNPNYTSERLNDDNDDYWNQVLVVHDEEGRPDPLRLTISKQNFANGQRVNTPKVTISLSHDIPYWDTSIIDIQKLNSRLLAKLAKYDYIEEIEIYNRIQTFDEFGNEIEKDVLNLSLSRGSLDKVVWKNFYPSNLKLVADEYVLNSDFE